jgi:hypothetical protein
MGYKLLGFVVWRGGIWLLKRRYPRLTDRRTVAVVLVGAGVAAALARSREAA